MLEILLSAGQVEQARDLVEEAAGFVANSHHRYLDAALAAGRGVTGCPPGREPTREQIAQCMDMLREPGMRGSLLVMRKVASSICNHALKYGIRTQLARQLIASERLEPPEDASTDWPWFVRIRTLGDFDVAVDGASLQKAGRSPHKVLELLKLLVAAGPRPQYVPALSDLLWPDADGADAKVSMHTTLHRLRRLLRDDRAVRLQDGKLWLDRSLCWTDVGSFERGSEALLRCDRAFDLDQRARGQQCLSLYAGPLMPGCDHPFVLAARDRLHAKFLKLTIRLADAFAHADRTRECIATLERGLELDPANEPLAARLAQQLVQLGRTDEAALLRAQGPGRP